METRRTFQASVLGAATAAAMAAQKTGSAAGKHYVRFAYQGKQSQGILEGDRVQAIQGPLLGAHKPTGAAHKLSDVKLLYPIEPGKILAVGLNYKSHLGTRTPPSQPEIFYKPTSCLQHPGEPIRIPPGAKNVHYEGELVVVIGKRLSRVNREQAIAGIFGVTCGNDVSERDWQNGPQKDLQWWRAKGSDTFGPLGPSIVTGIDYSKLQLETRLNGKSMQKQLTSDLLFDCPAIVSHVSQYVSLNPGDLIYTGTPGSTTKMSPGDVVEVEIEGIGILKNPVVAG
jgi:2-keto-4-pentenoate hydratase/2-oxohepta-3-ene-1,7-dioic acid hydratase in catechol pathway